MAAYSEQVLGEEAALAQAMLMRDLVLARMERVVPVSALVAGAEVSQVVPGGVFWHILNLKLRLTTSAVVGARTPSIVLNDQDGNRIARFAPGGSQAASITVDHDFGAGLGGAVNAGSIDAPLPTWPFFVLPGWTIATLTGALDVGDQYATTFLLIQEWSEWGIAHHVQNVAEQIAAAQS